ncbi:MAG: PAS domain S-box protein [bacterium]
MKKDDEHGSKPNARSPAQKPEACVESSDSTLTRSDLVETLRKLRSALTTAKTLAFDQDLELRYTKIHNPNPHFTEEMVLGRTDEDLFPADYAAQLTETSRLVVESGEPGRREVYLTIDGDQYTYDLVVVPTFDKTGTLTGISCVSIDSTVRRLLEDALIQSASKFRAVVNTTNDAIMVIDANTLIFDEVNPACVELYGYSRSEFHEMTPMDLTVEPDKTLLSIGETLAGKLGKAGTEYHRKKDGTLFPAEVTASTFSQSGRRMLCAVVRDVTERQLAEEKLRESEQKYRDFFEKDVSGSYLSTPNGKLLDCNLSFAEILGYPSIEELLATSTTELYLSPTDQQRFLARLKEDKKLVGFELNLVRKDGQTIHCVENVVGTFDERGHLVEFQGYISDITERRKAEEALRESEERFKSLFENAPVGYQSLDVNGNFIEINETWCRLLGYTKEEVLGRNFSEFIHPDFAEQFLENFPKFQKIGYILGIEFEMIKKDGSEIIVKSDEKIEYNEDGSFGRTHCVLSDITERKAAETALRESESIYRNTIENTNGVPYRLDLVSRKYDFVGAGIEDLLGVTPEEFSPQVYGKMIMEHVITHPDGQGDLAACFEAFGRGEVEQFRADVRIQTASGDIKWINDCAVPIRSDSGQVVGSLGILQDITERKQAEEALRQSEATLNKAQRLAKIGSWELDLTTNTLHWSDEIYRMFGVEPQKFGATYEAFLDHIHPDDRAFVDRAYTDSVNNRTPYDIVHRLLLKDGSLKFVNERCETSYDESGRAICSIGTVQDITERKQSEEALRESEERFRSITENAVDCIFIKDIARRYVFVNPAMQRLLGRPMAEIIGRTPAEVFGVEQDSMVDDRTFSGETVSEIRGMTIGEQELFFHTIQTPLSVTDGEVTSITGIVRDITDLRRRALELRDSEQRFHELYNNINDGVAVYTAVDDGKDFVIRDLNKAGQRLSKVELSNIVGRSILEVFPGVKEIGLYDLLKRVYQTGRPERLPLSRYLDNRIDEWIENYVYKLPSGEVVAVYHDLTHIKLLETDLARSSEQLQADQVALEAKSIALQEVLSEIQNEKDRLSHQIQANLDNVLAPLIQDLKDTADPKLQTLIDSLSRSLREVTSPFVNDLLSAHTNLTPREAKICKLIRQGLSSKETAAALSVSTETIRSSRKAIRRKLRISKKRVDLGSYLQSLAAPPTKS